MFILERVKPEDKEEILSFTKDTWDWGDYIPYIFDEWIESENGDFIKAVLNTKVVGISHIGYLSSWEAWLEGLRVHPDYRRMGIGTFLLDTSLDILKEKKIRIARNVITSTNIASQNLCRRKGFELVGEFALFTSKTTEQTVEGLMVALLKDINIILEIARTSIDTIPYLKKIGIYWNWEWQGLSSTAIERAINKAIVLVDQNYKGFGILRRSREDIEVTSLYGDFDSIKRIIGYALNLGYKEGIKDCEVIVPKEWHYKEELQNLGFIENPKGHTLLVFEKTIV